jgi:hypothetical protein
MRDRMPIGIVAAPYTTAAFKDCAWLKVVRAKGAAASVVRNCRRLQSMSRIL